MELLGKAYVQERTFIGWLRIKRGMLIAFTEGIYCWNNKRQKWWQSKKKKVKGNEKLNRKKMTQKTETDSDWICLYNIETEASVESFYSAQGQKNK